MEKSFVTPFLFDIKRSEVQGPILQFQSTIFQKDDIKKMVKTLNKACGDASILDTRLDKAFDVWYPTLEQSLNELKNNSLITNDSKDDKEETQSSEILEEILELSRDNQKLLRNPDSNLINSIEEIKQSINENNSRTAMLYDKKRRTRKYNTRERFEEQLRLRIESLKAKKKDVSKIKSDIKKLSTQKEKLLNLMLEEDDKLIVDTYKDKLNSVLSQIAFQNETLKIYENIDFEKEENFLREQSKMSYEHITYCDFQELDREQLKILFNKLIEKITIDEFSVPGEKEVCLNITINLKIPGYAPKYALQFKQDLKNREKEDKKKNTNLHKNESSYLDGGEGQIYINTLFGYWYRVIANPPFHGLLRQNKTFLRYQKSIKYFIYNQFSNTIISDCVFIIPHFN